MEKRTAGQHALSEGRKRVAWWTVAELCAVGLGFEKAERFARERVKKAERSWIPGGKAEEKVGVALERHRSHDFYIFHDVALPGLGNVDHVVLGSRGFFCIETKSHRGHVTSSRNQLLLNGRPTERNFVAQAWRGGYRLREILRADAVPLLCFTEAFVERRTRERGVRVLPLRWLEEAILDFEERHTPQEVKVAASALSRTTGCCPSAGPRLSPSRISRAFSLRDAGEAPHRARS